MTCPHEQFQAQVDVNRLTEEDGVTVRGFSADVRIECTQCRLPFRFVGTEAGYSPRGPRVSVDATELRAPIEPAYVVEILGRPLMSGRA